MLDPRRPVLRAPFPWFGGKSAVGRHVWDAFGDATHYVEPFAGSLGVLLSVMDSPRRHETVNDLDGYVTNVWRAIRADPETVAHWADYPASELDLTARHLWLVNEGRPDTARLASDPDYYDAKAAGWWVWGACCWIGSGWCSGKGPHTVASITGADDANAGRGVHRKLPHLANAGRGDALRRQRPDSADRAVRMGGTPRAAGGMVELGVVASGRVGLRQRDWPQAAGPRADLVLAALPTDRGGHDERRPVRRAGHPRLAHHAPLQPLNRHGHRRAQAGGHVGHVAHPVG